MFDFLKKKVELPTAKEAGEDPIEKNQMFTGTSEKDIRKIPKPKTLVMADYMKMNRAERRRLAKHTGLPMLKGTQKPVINNK